MNRKKFIAMVLMTAMIMSVLAIAAPFGVSALSESVLATNIHLGYPSLTTVADPTNHTVTVTGTVAGALGLSLDIDANVTVIWKASYSGAVLLAQNLITLNGNGTFEVPEGGSIVNSGPGDAIGAVTGSSGITIIVSGGTVSSSEGCAITIADQVSKIIVSSGIVSTSTGGASAINVLNTGETPNIAISGGTVSAGDTGDAIHVEGNTPTIKVSGGIVKAADGNAILVTGNNANITVSGGEVSLAATGSAVPPTTSAIEVGGINSTIMVSGGTVSAKEQKRGICATGDRATVTVSGGTVSAEVNEAMVVGGIYSEIKINSGFVFAYGSQIEGGTAVIDISGTGSTLAIEGDAVVCAWNQGLGKRDYDSDTTFDMIVKPEGMASWARSEIYSGIAYANGENVGFFPITTTPPLVVTPTVYTVTFDSDEGSAVSNLSVTSGAKATKPDDPEKAGYTFAGWYTEAALTTAYDFNSNVKSNFTLYAKWTEAVYKLTFDSDEGSEVTEQSIASGAKATKPADPEKEGFDFAGWYTEAALTTAYDFDTPVTEDFTLYAKWAEAAFAVTFDSNGGSAVTEQSIASGEKATKPADPTKTGFDFAGWYTDAALTTAYNFDTPVSADLKLYAKWAEAAIGSMANFTQSKTYLSGQFTDVDENQWYGYNDTRAIANAFVYGLMVGDSDSIFRPGGDIKLNEAITMAVRVHSIYTTGQIFAVSTNPWYQGYVEYAIQNGIIKAGDFSDYGKEATRAEMAYIFTHALPENEFAEQNTLNGLPDVNVATPYYSAITMFYKSGILAGNDIKGTFYPQNNITRAEAAAIISRVILPMTRFSGKTYSQNVYIISDYYSASGEFSMLGAALTEQGGEKALNVKSGDIIVVSDQKYMIADATYTLFFYTQSSFAAVNQWWSDYVADAETRGIIKKVN